VLNRVVFWYDARRQVYVSHVDFRVLMSPSFTNYSMKTYVWSFVEKIGACHHCAITYCCKSNTIWNPTTPRYIK